MAHLYIPKSKCMLEPLTYLRRVEISGQPIVVPANCRDSSLLSGLKLAPQWKVKSSFRIYVVSGIAYSH